MPALGAHLDALSDAERKQLESWLLAFDQGWNERRWTKAVAKLPASGPLRRPALIEMAKIDLERRWQRDQPVGHEYYLYAATDLGPDAPLDLLVAEFEVRRQFGDPAGAAALADRFPDLAAVVRRAPGSAPAGSHALAAETVARYSTGTPRESAGDGPALPERFGRYRVLRRLGQGGMGSVYLAHDTQLDRRVALKVPHLTPDSDPELLRSFEREARAASTLDHPNLSRVYDVGTIDGIPYLSMAYIEGRPLADEVKSRGPLPERQAAALARKLALALHEAHRAGVVHRDLKPANIMLTPRGEPVVTDFGLARRDCPDEQRLTTSGQMLGTPAYMAPEQVRGDAATAGPACDVYALGVILYECLTGRPPFRGSHQAVFGQIVTAEPPRPSTIRPDLDPALESTCLKAMAKQPEDRFASMQEFAAALTRALKGGGRAPAQVAAGRRWWPAALVAAAAVIGTVGGLAWYHGTGGGTPADGQDARPVSDQYALKNETAPTAALRADDAVTTVAVTLTAGAGGKDLEERVALDLGLGFPLWLDPLGAKPNSPAPFGALPQKAAEGAVLRSGESATFTFAAAGDKGKDVLHTAAQLLANVRVGDIRRVAFTGPGAGEWELAGYEVRVNDRVIAAGKPGVTPKKLLDEASAKLATVGKAAGPLERERADLRDLVRAKLATPDDTRKLDELDQKLATLTPDKERLEARLQGKAPWYVVPSPELLARPGGAAVRTARVKILTGAHEGADTRNQVYFGTGAAKYAVGSPLKPLSPMAGMQEFDLDLDAGPLSPEALRGWSLGVLAAPEPQGDVPDRWHPRRLMVEIDGKLAYDSEQQDRDRRSLDAVRLIPPAQLDWNGAARDNPPAAREVYLWSAGAGLGLDDAGNAVRLPPPDSPAAPKREPGLLDTALAAKTDPGDGAPADGAPGPPPGDAAPPPPADLPPAVPVDVGDGGAPNFPGEVPILVPVPGPTTVIIVAPIYPPALDPPPAGRPFQVRDVRVTAGVRANDVFTVQWDLAGDEAAVDHYEVYLVRTRPENSAPGAAGPLYGERFLLNAYVPAGVRTSTAVPAGLAVLAYDPQLTVRPLVRAVPVNPAVDLPNQRFGPARAVFPVSPLRPQPALHALFWRSAGGAPPAAPPLVPTLPTILGVGRTPGTTTAAWQAGRVECNGVVFDDAPAGNVAVRLNGPAETARVWLRTGMMPPPPAGKRRHLVAFLGFEGPAVGAVDVRASWYKTPAGPGAAVTGPWQTVTAPAVLPVQMEVPFNPADPPHFLTLRYDFRNFNGDPANPPTLLGVRLVEEP